VLLLEQFGAGVLDVCAALQLDLDAAFAAKHAQLYTYRTDVKL